MKKKIILLGFCIYCAYTSAMHAQEVIYVNVHDKEREKAELNAGKGYTEVFTQVLWAQQKALNYKRRMLIDNVFVTEFQREALNSDMNINQEVIKLMEKNIQKLRDKIDEIWQYYDKEFMGKPNIAPLIRTYYEAKKKQTLEDTELIDRKVNAFIKGQGVSNTIASPRQRMEIIRDIRKEYQQIYGISLKQANIFRMIIIGKQKEEQERGGQP